MEPLNVIVEGVLPAGKSLNFVLAEPTLVYELKMRICDERFISPHDYFLTANGVLLEDSDNISCTRNSFRVLRAHPLLLGGKGGFGTLIRSMGTQINKGSRKGACRDLSGRRMRDVEAEKKLAKWMALEPERKKRCMEQRKKRLERRRNQPKHHFNDSSYMDQIHSTEENMRTALQQGLQASTASTIATRAEEASTDVVKKQGIWVGVDDDSDEYSSSDSEQLSNEVTEDDPDNSLKGIEAAKELATTPNTAGGIGTINDTEEVLATEFLPDSNKSSICESKGGDASVNLKGIDLQAFSTVNELVSLGGDALKCTLQSMGLKCGGTATERAQRLLSTKGKSIHEIDRSLFAKNKKWKSMKPST